MAATPPTDRSQKTLLVISQVYVPDPASVGQHMADATAELASRGWRVVVYTANRGYDDPSVRYPAREILNGVEVQRLGLSSFGKKTILIRLLGQLSFLAQCTIRGLLTRRLAGLFFTTSPPMAAIAALIISWCRRVPAKYWVMDLNPDQAVLTGKVKAQALSVRAFDWLNRRILGRAADVVTLDRFMAGRLMDKRHIEGKLAVMPPWPHDDHLEVVEHKDNPFRSEHHLDGKFVIMYSGNHSPSHPLTTIVEAALRLKGRDELSFMFIGGGMAKQEVEKAIAEHHPDHILSLPYQPLDRIKYSLSAADVHLVVMGDHVVGCVHPCKVYGAMALCRPILLLGPSPCHVSDLIDEHHIGWHIPHGDVEGAVATIQRILETDRRKLAEMGRRAREVVESKLSKQILSRRFCDVIERGL